MDATVMTVDNIKKCVNEIKITHDDQAAHAMEDVLYASVLRAIAEGMTEDPAECAEAVLETKSLNFIRDRGEKDGRAIGQ